MTENRPYIKEVYHLYDVMRDTFFSKNIGFGVIRLIFLKYASDNCLGAYTREEMQDYIKVQKLFAARDVGAGPNGIVPVLDLMDKHYNLGNLMHSSINEYAKELFGLDDSWNKKNTSERNFVEIMSILSSMDLTDNLETHEVGKVLVSVLVDNLQYHGENAKFASPYYSRREIGVLANKILNVKDNEIFLDFCSGVGTTTITSVGYAKCKVINHDINEEALSVASMLYIMYGYEDFVMEQKDGFPEAFSDVEEKPVFEIADKIFVDPPLGIKIKNNPLRDSAIIALSSAAAYLKDNGTAIVAIPSSALGGMGNFAGLLREKLVGNQYVQAVIALPMAWPGTMVSMNLVVLSKRQNKGVLFVNACGNALKNIFDINERTYKRTKGNVPFSDNQLDELASIINDGKEIDGLSRLVDLNEIVAKEYRLIPNLYVSDVIETDSVSLKEIDDELDALYSKLIKMTI